MSMGKYSAVRKTYMFGSHRVNISRMQDMKLRSQFSIEIKDKGK